MSTYVIGDIHGCARTLDRLLDRVAYDPAVDRLWQVGDLVNRGPRSLKTMRWAVAQGDRLRCVLGNHDLHLLGRAAGARRRNARDTMNRILKAPDRDELLDWLRRQAFFVREGDFAMVHAGILPGWTLAQTEGYARELQEYLGGPDWDRRVFELYKASTPRDWSADLTGPTRLRFIVDVLTRLRYVTRRNRLHEFNGPPKAAPRNLSPWFATRPSDADGVTLVFGHWASLGRVISPGLWALDSGCVWGGALSAVRLDDGEVFEMPNAD